MRLPSPIRCADEALRCSRAQVTRFHSRTHVDEILRLCADSERRAELATSGNGREGKRSGRRSSGGVREGIMFIDSDTAIMRSSREAIMRAAGAACKAVDEVRRGSKGWFSTPTVRAPPQPFPRSSSTR